MDTTYKMKLARRMSAKIRVNVNGCWEWTASIHKSGYSKVSIKPAGKVIMCYGHRLMYELVYGQIDSNLVIRHSCHNKLCLNPKHLSTGTHQDNANDKVSANRQARQKGSQHPQSKLTEADVINMRAEYKLGGVTYADLAKKYGVDKTTVGHNIRGAWWKHI